MQNEEHAEITKHVEGEMRDKWSLNEWLEGKRERNEIFYNFGDKHRKRKGKNQAKISLKNEKLSRFLLMFMGEGIWKLEGLETREVRIMDATYKIFVCAYG